MTSTEHLVYQLQQERDRLRFQLISHASGIIDDMQKLVDRLKVGEWDNVNALGELQSAGQFNILCARYVQVKYHLEMVQATLKEPA